MKAGKFLFFSVKADWHQEQRRA